MISPEAVNDWSEKEVGANQKPEINRLISLIAVNYLPENKVGANQKLEIH